MTEILFIIGVFVFFISVYGAVMVGGHLLEELEHDQSAADRVLDRSPRHGDGHNERLDRCP